MHGILRRLHKTFKTEPYRPPAYTLPPSLPKRRISWLPRLPLYPALRKLFVEESWRPWKKATPGTGRVDVVSFEFVNAS
jgi:hypothetical protein